jgi:hypothetical protein
VNGPVRTYYQSTLLNGRIWCQSRDPQEVVQRSAGQRVVFRKMEVFETTVGWVEWFPEVAEASGERE